MCDLVGVVDVHAETREGMLPRGFSCDVHGTLSMITPHIAASTTRRSGVIHFMWSGLLARSSAWAMSDDIAGVIVDVGGDEVVGE